MSKVANPALVIGLGGTGQWILTYLKKNLIDTYGEVPKAVRLLAFDTTSAKTEAEVSRDKKVTEEKAQVGTVTLGTGEFIYLGGNIKRYCEDIKERGKHPHIGSWLQAETYLQTYDDDAYDISKGAGQRRQFGRMAVFYDLSMGDSQIRGKIETAITEILKENERRQPIEIYVICSIAGGTGSGMFLDIAHIARKLAQAGNASFAVRGFVVLQNTFDPVIPLQSVLPNSFAAMRELDRFMLVFNREYPIYYHDEYREPKDLYHGIHTSKIFDSCYLIDSVRANRSLHGVEPKFGVYPSVAEAITALLDPETGNTFDQHYKNVNNDVALAQQEIARSPSEAGSAIYSSLGTYTYILPVFDIIERNTLKLTLDLLRNRLLKLEQEPGGLLTATSSGQHEFNVQPKEAAFGFLAENKSREGVLNLHFNQQVSAVLQSGRTKDAQYISDTAALGIELLTWLLPAEEDPVIAQTASSLQKAMEVSLLGEVPNSKIERDDFHSAADRIARDVRKIHDELLGYEESGGRKALGELQKGLNAYGDRNVDRFRTLVTERLRDILNGLQDDSLVSRQGKLPYAREWLDWLIQSYDEFVIFMREVIKTWTSQNEVAMAREDVARTKQIMYDNRDATGLIDRLGGRAIKAQDAYIGAENYLLDLERQEALMRGVIELAEAFKSVAQDARGQLLTWLAILALGGNVDTGEIGTYRALQGQQEALTQRRQKQVLIKVYEYLTDEKYEDELYERCVTPEKLREVLRAFEWQVATTAQGIAVDLFYKGTPLRTTSLKGETATQFNAKFLLDNLRPYFSEIRNETIANRMEFLKTAERAAKELLDNSGALISYQPNEQKRSTRRNFVSVNSGAYVGYFNDLGAELARSAPTAKENKVIGLSNPHRCIVLSTTDLLVGKYTAPYQSTNRAYTEYNGDRRLLHNFPAEVNSTWYEQRLPKAPLHQTVRLLSPVLVALLEDREMVRRFALSMFYDMVRLEESAHMDNANEYMLRLDRINPEDIAAIRLTPASPAPDLIDAMMAFVYPKIDQETNNRFIQDVTLDTARGVSPERIEETLKRRREVVLSGLESITVEFEQRLRGWSDMLMPVGKAHLPGILRRFIVENERQIKRGEQDTLRARLDVLLYDNDDCYQEPYKNELRDKILEILGEFSGERIQAVDVGYLMKKIERYIREQIKPKYDADSIRRLPADQKPSQLIQDLYSILHLVLWDEVQRLRQLA